MKLSRALGVVTLVLALTLAGGADAQRRRGRRAPPPPPPPSVAQHVTIMDGASGAILFCDACNTPIQPASMSKLMTAYMVAERLRSGRVNMNTRLRVSENAWRHGAMSDGSHMFLELNSEVSVGDLLRGLIIVSANDACIVLAEGIWGSEEAMVADMNNRAQALGLRTARFHNTTGLPDPGHVISSADLARLARILITQHPEIYRLYSQRNFTYNNHTQENRNPLLGAFDGADGMKTGHIDESGYGLVGSAALNGQRRIIVFNGTRSMADRRNEALRIMRAAFNDYSITRVAVHGAQVGEARVRLGSRATVPLVAQRDIVIGGPRGVQSRLTARIVYSGPLRAPIAQGAVVAHLVIEGPGFPRQQFPLAAGRRIGRANWFSRAWEGLRLTMFGPS